MYAPQSGLRRKAPGAPPQRRQQGLSIVEVMVGMVVSLMVGLAAAGSAQLFTASQRQGIGAGGSLINGSTALSAIRDDVAAAGLGFFGDSRLLCAKLNLSVGAAVVQNGTDFTPVAVTPETAGDRIDVISATQVASGANVLLKTATTGAATAELRSLLPVSVGQAVLLAPSTTGAPCVVRSVTAVQDSTDLTPQRLSFGASGDNSRFNQASFTTNPTFTANDYPDIGRVALLGDLRWTRYRLQGTDLRLERPLVTGDPVVLVRNVVAFRAQYGVAAASGTSLESWESATGDFATVGTANVARVRALQVGLVTRSPQAEKPAAGDNTNCTNQPVTASMPSLFGTAATADVTNWRCYRYRTAIVVVPLRNLVVGMTP